MSCSSTTSLWCCSSASGSTSASRYTSPAAIRTAAHNAAVGGSKSSQHLLGRAADFYVEGVDVATVAAYAEALLPGRGGIGRYPKDAKHPKRSTGWVHIDTRANKSRWSM